MTETVHNVEKLLQAAENVDKMSDKGREIQSAAKAIHISGHEWGAVGGMFFSDDYSDAVGQINEHLTLLNGTLTAIESGMEETAKTYAGANQAILDRISALENDLKDTPKPAGA
ncbi:hypothetical protein [Actinomadura rupiterrae]|uniref:hypothetical protein n=1 Tax=Actinomadura rupiterrae TaxID=559627 RepID=UPI0020A2DA52|nr:hypothetical protein [Actinomadura rupiterrae]MCP2335984.1 uncharacterized protein YukE [Actinomadura rupiterrae]